MNLTIDHTAAKSLKEFLSYKLLNDLRAFRTVSGTLTKYDPKWQNLSAFGSSYAGFTYDAGISGAIIPTGLSGVSGVVVDYRNGRFIGPTGANFTGQTTFSVNEVNFYITSSPESKLIFETKYLQSPVRTPATGYIPPDSFVAPCVFVKSFSSESEDHAFGGESRSSFNFKVVAMMRRESELLGIQKVVRDARSEVFPMITGSVFNQYGGLTTPGWTYSGLFANMPDYFFVEDSTFKIVEADVFTDDNPKMYVGIGNIEVSYYSNPRESSRPDTITYFEDPADGEFFAYQD